LWFRRFIDKLFDRTYDNSPMFTFSVDDQAAAI
jgi:hypothetical protein